MDREMMALSGRLPLGDGTVLRLLSGMELLEARVAPQVSLGHSC